MPPLQIVPLTAADHKELHILMQQIQAEKQQKKEQHPTVSTQNPTIEWLIWIVKPPTLSSGRVEYVVKRLLTAPFRCVLLMLGVDVHCSVENGFPAMVSCLMRLYHPATTAVQVGIAISDSAVWGS